MHITISYEQFRALVRGEAVTLDVIEGDPSLAIDDEPIEAILADIGFNVMVEEIRNAADEHIRAYTERRLPPTANAVCGACLHPVDEHYDMGCIHKLDNGEPCRCIESWRDEMGVSGTRTVAGEEEG